MTKTDFIKNIVENVNEKYVKSYRGKEIPFTQSDVKAVLDSVNTVVCDAVANEDEVMVIPGVTLTSYIREARMGRNPRTGESIEIPEKRVPKAKFGKAFKDACVA